MIAIPESYSKRKSSVIEKWDTIRQHQAFSAEVLEPILKLKQIVNLILYHHKKRDGKGYLEGRNSDQTPLQPHRRAVCDAYSAMTGGCPYRKAMSSEVPVRERERVAGKQLDTTIARLFLELRDRGLSKDILTGEHKRLAHPQVDRGTIPC
jgi:HD-GYP domain-containing protein (c-di-GMP phosphodiesterase class II)